MIGVSDCNDSIGSNDVYKGRVEPVLVFVSVTKDRNMEIVLQALNKSKSIDKYYLLYDSYSEKPQRTE